MSTDILFSIITPSAGKRPAALAQAIDSVSEAARFARIVGRVEMLVGFDGIRGERPIDSPWVRYVDFPAWGDFGNRIRDSLIKVAKGRRILFVDDDNMIHRSAFYAWMANLDADMVVGQVDTRRAFDEPFLPQREAGEAAEKVMRQCNVDPLCLCLEKKLVQLCGGWRSQGRYESDFLNIRRYFVRSRSFRLINDVVGIYDAGRGLDPEGMNSRQSGQLGSVVLQRELAASVYPSMTTI